MCSSDLLKYFENNEKYAFFYDEQQQKWYYWTAPVRVYFEKPKEEVKYGDDPKSIVKKLKEAIAQKEASMKTQILMIKHGDEIQDRLSGVYSRRGNRSWRTGEPLKRGKVS